ncbi:hypothetical protein [Nocardia testacea]|uniref:hypothetical protein n=1 Tax=Nocardia testacea TaxID=248551 RepID=UPI003A8A7C22
MTGRERVLFDTEVSPDRLPILSTAPLELELAESLPDVCSEHGLPSVESRPFVVNSMGQPGSEIPTMRGFLGSIKLPWKPGENYRVQARLRFECPACEYCLYEVRRFRRRALLALSAVVLTLAALVAAVLFEVEQLYVPLGFAAVPGCFPIASAVGLIAWMRSDYFADVWLTDSTEQLIVSAHPDFVAAANRLRARERD